MNVQQIRKALFTELKSLDARRAKVRTAIKALGGNRSGGGTSTESVTFRRKPTFTKAGLARIAAAQRARWKKLKAAKIVR